MRLTASAETLLADNELVDNKKHGVYLDTESSRNIVRDNHFRGNLIGAYILGQDTAVTANVMTENGYGIRLSEPAANNRLWSNRIEHNATAGIYVTTQQRNFAGENVVADNTLNYL